MIILALKGGLGNQMFQYALGRRMAHIRRTELKLDLSYYDFQAHGITEDTPRKYRLSTLNIKESIATDEEIALFFPTDKVSLKLLNGLRNRLLPYYLGSIVKEKASSFDPAILKTRKHVYLNGYWQTEKYFLDLASLIRSEFTVKSPLNEINLSIANQMRPTNSVSIHVRRGDYIINQATHDFHGVCSLDYYKRAVAEISAEITDPLFFVFSDDPEWTQDNIQLHHPTVFVTHNGVEEEYEDLRLMSLCKHHIIANSSFSWWGAWLGTNRDKIVIAPKKWFNTADMDTKDLLPERWRKM